MPLYAHSARGGSKWNGECSHVTSSLIQRWGRSYACHSSNELNDDFAGAGAGIEFDEDDLLPRADIQVSAVEGDRDRRPEHRRTHMARPVVVAPSQMMFVLAMARREVLPDAIEIGHRTRLEFDGRHTRSGSDDGDSGEPGFQ